MFELLIVAASVWILVKITCFALKVTWSLAKVIAAICLLAGALPIVVLCLLCGSGLALLLPFALIATVTDHLGQDN